MKSKAKSSAECGHPFSDFCQAKARPAYAEFHRVIESDTIVPDREDDFVIRLTDFNLGV